MASPNDFLPRAIVPALERALRVHPIVVLTGARQTGKSTLVRTAPFGTDRLYVTLDRQEALSAARTAADDFIRRAPVMTIDEVQRAPDVLLTLKQLVDEQHPRVRGQFLLTGSANVLLMRQVADSLAGRASYLKIWPMTRRELLGAGSTGIWSQLIDTPRRDWYALVRDQDAPAGVWQDSVRRGGYPTPAYELETDVERTGWFEGYLDTYLQRDIPDLSPIENMPDFRQLMRAVTLRLGALQNQSALARDVKLPQPTIHRYLNLLETSYQLVRLPAYAKNRTLRLIKAPKLYWSDTGMALHLSGSTTPQGEHLENLVLADLQVWRDTCLPKPEVYYWRTAAQHEVDFVIETPTGHLMPIEVKTTATPRTKDLASMLVFKEEYGDAVLGGLVLHGGTETYWIAEGVLAAPWWKVL